LSYSYLRDDRLADGENAMRNVISRGPDHMYGFQAVDVWTSCYRRVTDGTGHRINICATHIRILYMLVFVCVVFICSTLVLLRLADVSRSDYIC